LRTSRRAGFGVAANLFATACYAAVTVLLYALFKVVNRNLARLVIVTSLTALAIWASGSLSELAATLVAPGGDASRPRTERQGRMLLQWNAHALDIGPRRVRGVLPADRLPDVKSTFLPRVLGILMTLGGIGLLTHLSPPLACDLYPYNEAPALVDET
jgi:hypothetical protein